MSKLRKIRQPEEKLQLVKRHLMGKESVVSICEEEGIAPSQFYQWQQELFDQGAQCFTRKKKGGSKSAEQQKIEQLERQLACRERKLAEKNEVIAELVADHTKLKKTLGGG